MKIFFVVHSFDTKDRGGVLKVVSDLTESFAFRTNLDVQVVSFRKVEELAFHLGGTTKLVSLNLKNYNTTSYKGLKKIQWFREAYNSISSIIMDNQDAIWITSSPPITLLFSILKRKFNIKVIGCDHISTVYGKKFPVDLVRYSLIRKLDLMVALTPPDRDFYLSKNIPSIYIPNAIDFSKINKLKNDRKYIVFVGRFHDVKQPLKAMQLFLDSEIYKKGLKMKLFGQGRLYEEIIKFISDNQCQDYFEVITNESNQDNIFKDAYALLMTSKVEGLPMVLLEAIARNVPCLAFDCPYGPATIIQNGINGFIIEDNVQDFKEKLLKLADINKNKISDSISEFSIENVTTNWVNLFEKLNKK